MVNRSVMLGYFVLASTCIEHILLVHSKMDKKCNFIHDRQGSAKANALIYSGLPISARRPFQIASVTFFPLKFQKRLTLRDPFYSNAAKKVPIEPSQCERIDRNSRNKRFFRFNGASMIESLRIWEVHLEKTINYLRFCPCPTENQLKQIGF